MEAVKQLLEGYGIEVPESGELDMEQANELIVQKIKSDLLESEDFLISIPKEKLPQSYFDHTEVVQKNVSEIYGKTKKKIRGLFGLSDEEMAQISPEDQKDTFLFSERAKELYDARRGNVIGEADVLLKQNWVLKDQLEEINTSIPRQIEEAVNNERLKASNEIFNYKLEQKIYNFSDNIPNLAISISPLIQNLKEAYDLKIENNQIVFYEKGKEFRVKHPEKNGEWLDLEFALKKIVPSWVGEQPKPVEPVRTLITPSNGSVKYNNPELAKAWEGK